MFSEKFLIAKTTREKKLFLTRIKNSGSFFSQGPETIKYEKKIDRLLSFLAKRISKKHSELNLKLLDNQLKSCFLRKDRRGQFWRHLVALNIEID